MPIPLPPSGAKPIEKKPTGVPLPPSGAKPMGILSRVAPPTNHPVLNFFRNFADGGEAANKAGSELGDKMISEAKLTEAGKQTVPEQILNTAGALGAGSVKAVGGTFMEVAKTLAPKWLEKTGAYLAEGVSKSAGMKGVNAVIEPWKKLYEDLEINNPRLANDLMGALELGSSSLAIATGPKLVSGVADATVAAPKKIADLASKTSTKISDIASSAKGKIVGKTKSQVLATLEADVPKLNAAERRAWYENQRSQIDIRHEAMSTKVKQDLAAKAEIGLKEAEDLQRELAVTSRDKTLDLRPKMIAGMGEQSKTYRSLVDEAMDGKESLPVDKGDLKGFIDSRFPDDPAKAASIKDKLGLTETVDPLSTGRVSPKLRKTKTTLGEIYEQTKSLRQEMSSSKVFSADDKMTDDAIHTLLSYMKENGVDLKDANSFWAKYAPVRDQMISEANPFLQVGTKTGKFASTLTKVAKGADVNNEIFISEVEKIVGEPIMVETKTVLGKLDKNRKLALADEIEASSRQVDIDMARDKSLAKLSDIQFEIERKARVRDTIKKILLYGLGTTAVGATVKGVTGN
jgi:hypothetical protein